MAMPTSDLKYDLETVPCALCGSDRHDVYFSRAKELYNGFDEYFDVVRCRECGFVFTNPRPTAATIGCFYPDSAQYYQPKTSRVTAGNWSRKKWKKALQQSVLARRFGYELRRLPSLVDFLPGLIWRNKLRLAHVPHFVPNGRLLDIGCAWGGYLWRMQELGWEVYGIELNATAARFAREELGLANVRSGSFADLDFPDGSFDVVHMSMVLEHLYDPVEALQRINTLLRNDGQFILSVPDISGFEARLFKDKCYTLQVPQHLSHFTPATVTRFLCQAGFDVEDILHQRAKKDFLQSAEYLQNKALAHVLKNPLVKGAVLGPLVGMLAALGKTSRMSIFARKERTL
jgi:2-polyprenyl-3-methyl-5-hydroxy-6-metoxy-1,4-benzoquinol methylase